RPGHVGERVEAEGLELRVPELPGQTGPGVRRKLGQALLEEPPEREALRRGFGSGRLLLLVVGCHRASDGSLAQPAARCTETHSHLHPRFSADCTAGQGGPPGGEAGHRRPRTFWLRRSTSASTPAAVTSPPAPAPRTMRGYSR